MATFVQRLLAGEIERPRWYWAFILVMISYFIVTAGIAYDIINEPPAIGGAPDPRTGAIKPQVFMPNRVNGQYIIEGLSGGFLYTVGGVGIVLLHLSREKTTNRQYRQAFLTAGLCFCLVAYSGCLMFLKIKMPGYLR